MHNMRRLFILFALAVFFGRAQARADYFSGGISQYFSANVLVNFPFLAAVGDTKPPVKIDWPIYLAAISFGAGVHFVIAQDVFLPGFYMELGFMPFNTPGWADTGIWMPVWFEYHVYNQFKPGPFGICPFFGRSTVDGYGHYLVGIMLSYKNVGVEYGYHWPASNPARQRPGIALHRLAFGFHKI